MAPMLASRISLFFCGLPRASTTSQSETWLFAVTGYLKGSRLCVAFTTTCTLWNAPSDQYRLSSTW